MVGYSKVNVRLTDIQLKNLTNAVKNKTGTTLRMSLKTLVKMICLIKYYWQQNKKLS